MHGVAKKMCFRVSRIFWIPGNLKVENPVTKRWPEGSFVMVFRTTKAKSRKWKISSNPIGKWTDRTCGQINLHEGNQYPWLLRPNTKSTRQRIRLFSCNKDSLNLKRVSFCMNRITQHRFQLPDYPSLLVVSESDFFFIKIGRSIDFSSLRNSCTKKM